MAKLPKTIQENLGKIPFDQYSRQYIAWRLVESIRKEDEKLRILDIGGHGGRTREFFPNDEVHVLDLYDVDEPWYIKGNALSMDVEDSAYDIALSFDVLEHIPQEKREKFLSEATRASSRMTAIAAPFHSKYIAEAEKTLNDYFQELTGSPHEWLEEHIEYGLPKRENLEKYLRKHNLEYEAINSNNLSTWEILQFTVLLTVASNVSSKYIEEIYEYYNKNLTKLADFEEDSYRAVYAIYTGEDKVNLKSILKSGQHPTSQIELHELIFKHIAAMQQNMKTQLSGKELGWYQATSKLQQKRIQELEAALHAKTLEMNKLTNSKSWQITKPIRLIRRIIGKLLGEKDEE